MHLYGVPSCSGGSHPLHPAAVGTLRSSSSVFLILDSGEIAEDAVLWGMFQRGKLKVVECRKQRYVTFNLDTTTPIKIRALNCGSQNCGGWSDYLTVLTYHSPMFIAIRLLEFLTTTTT